MASWTDKQTRFVEEYTVDFNAAAAAKRAGYSKKTARQAGYRNLQDPEIKEAIDERLERLSMSAEEATKRMTDLARGSFSHFITVDEHGARLNLNSDEAQNHYHLLKKVKQDETVDDEGVRSRHLTIELHDSKDALKQMLKVHGMYVDRVEHTGADGERLQGSTIVVQCSGEVPDVE